MSSRILIVDDAFFNRRILASIVNKAGFESVLACNGSEALLYAREAPPDLVLLDVMMPGKDGYAVCAELKADAALADIPVIFLSSLDEPADKIKGISAGAADYITKPFDGGEVLARVQSHLRLRQLTRALQSLNRDLVEKQRLLDNDLSAAAGIQGALIPRPDLKLPGLELSWLFVPSSAVGGDIFNAQQLDAEHVALYILDVNGHGVTAAMVAVLASQSLSPAMGLAVHSGGSGEKGPRVAPPAEVIRGLEKEFPFERFERYFTISYLVLHVPSGRLRYCTAAHPFPLLGRGDGTLRILEEGGSIVGLGLGVYDEGEVHLQRGDRIFLYTDGIVEYGLSLGKPFGDARLHEVLLAARCLPLSAVGARLQSALASFGAGSPFEDDISFLACEYQGIPA